MLLVPPALPHAQGSLTLHAVKVFDLLYLNGMSLVHKSLKFRKRNLRSCLREVPGRIEFVSEREGKTAKDVRVRMEEIMAERGEGLVLKHPDSQYILNGRNKDWIKVSCSTKKAVAESSLMCGIGQTGIHGQCLCSRRSWGFLRGV